MSARVVSPAHLATSRTRDDIELKRVQIKPQEVACDACSNPDFTKENNVLLVVMPDTTVCLCPFHEGLVLEKMLNNYLKRQRKGQKWGYIGPLAKDFGPTFLEGVRQISLATGQENRAVMAVMQHLEDEWKSRGNKKEEIRVVT